MTGNHIKFDSLLWTTLNYYTSALSPMYAHIYTAHLSFRFLLIFTLVLEMHKLTWTLTQTCIVSDVARWRSPRNLICIPHTFHRQLLCLWHNITHTHTTSEQAKCNYGELLQLESLQSQLITISGTVNASASTLDWTFPNMSALLTVVYLPPLWPCFSFLFISEGCDWAILALFVTQPPSFFIVLSEAWLWPL